MEVLHSLDTIFNLSTSSVGIHKVRSNTQLNSECEQSCLFM